MATFIQLEPDRRKDFGTAFGQGMSQGIERGILEAQRKREEDRNFFNSMTEGQRQEFLKNPENQAQIQEMWKRNRGLFTGGKVTEGDNWKNAWGLFGSKDTFQPYEDTSHVADKMEYGIESPEVSLMQPKSEGFDFSNLIPQPYATKSGIPMQDYVERKYGGVAGMKPNTPEQDDLDLAYLRGKSLDQFSADPRVQARIKYYKDHGIPVDMNKLTESERYALLKESNLGYFDELREKMLTAKSGGKDNDLIQKFHFENAVDYFKNLEKQLDGLATPQQKLAWLQEHKKMMQHRFKTLDEPYRAILMPVLAPMFNYDENAVRDFMDSSFTGKSVGTMEDTSYKMGTIPGEYPTGPTMRLDNLVFTPDTEAQRLEEEASLLGRTKDVGNRVYNNLLESAGLTPSQSYEEVVAQSQPLPEWKQEMLQRELQRERDLMYMARRRTT